MEAFNPSDISCLILVILIAAAFFAGFVDGVAGGGGLISLPSLLAVGIPPHFALGTNKFMCSIGTIASLYAYSKSKAVLWKVVAVGVAFSLLGSSIGAKTALMIDNAILGKIMIFLLPVAAVMTFIPIRKKDTDGDINKTALYLLTPLITVAIGFYDGFFGPGTGTFLLLGLHFCLGVNLVMASGTSKAFNLASNLASLIVFFISGHIYFFIAIPMAIANMVGNVMGARMALKGGPKVVRRMLLVSLGLLFITLIWRYYGNSGM